MTDFMKKLAEDLCSVQPMNIPPEIFASGKSKEELIRDGYKPVSKMGLVWIKDVDKEDE